MSKTVFVVFSQFPNTDSFTQFECVRTTWPKASDAARFAKPAVILEVLTGDGEKQIVNRWELS